VLQTTQRAPSVATGRQCTIKPGANAIGAAALRAFTATDEKTLLRFGCDFSRLYNFVKILKTVATRCRVLNLKCTEFDFGWGERVDITCPDL